MKKTLSLLFVLSLGCANMAQSVEKGEPLTEESILANAKEANANAELITTQSGLKYVVTAEGTGNKAGAGTKVNAHYTGKLMDGTVFDSSIKRGKPFSFTTGARKVIKGWDEAFADMKKGEKRILIIPPKLGYGSRGTGPIPADSTLVFDVELLDF